MMTNVFQVPEGPKAVPSNSVTTTLVDERLFIDFNKVIQTTLEQQREQLTKWKAIIRCDNLPHIQAGENELSCLSDTLIHLILRHPPKKSKLFIYIKCNQPESGTAIMAAETGKPTMYEICFHTNSCNEASWQVAHGKEISACAAICAKHSGVFTAAYGHADSLFKFTLPGKFI